MPNQIQAGTMMVQHSASMRSLEIESEPYSGSWHSLRVLESSGLDRKVRAAGWSLFFMAGELKTVVPAWGGESTLRRGVTVPGSNSAAAFQLSRSNPYPQEALPRHSVCVHSRTLPPHSGWVSDSRSSSMPKIWGDALRANE